ncbi:hypothetical protein Tco_1082268 [Tanacetum coccineum]|uniref:Uncharacterized protein n=1 Tax=Tanacetum coccineum TaxID=301880 RepID=A0ABQ5HZY7_9ASTR
MNVVMVYVHFATDVASHLVAYTRERKGGYSCPSATKSISKVQPHKSKCCSRGFASSYLLRQKQLVLSQGIVRYPNSEEKRRASISSSGGLRCLWWLKDYSEEGSADYVLLRILLIYEDPLKELLLALLRGRLPEEHSNLHSRISMEKFPRSFFSPTPLIKHLDHIS